jgi:hypothetical protein
VSRSHRECSQGRVATRGLEVACLLSPAGSPMGWSLGRATPSLAKSDLSASFWTGRVALYSVNGPLRAPVIHAITSDIRNTPLTDEVSRCPSPGWGWVSLAYKSNTKGPTDAPATGTASPRPRSWRWRQRRSRNPGSQGSERQNLRMTSGPVRSTGQVSPMLQATKWPGGTSSRQGVGSLRNGLIQPERVHSAVRLH